MNYVRTYFENLSVLQKIEYIILLLLAFSVPISWALATKILALLVVEMLIRLVVEKGRGVRLNKHSNKRLFLFFTTTYLLYAISMLYTSNVAEGWQNMEKKLSFLILPLFFWASDLRYLSQKHVKTLFYGFMSGLLFFIVGNLLWATYDYIFLDAPVSRFLGYEATKIYYTHHTYMAMYACVGIIYSFVELFETHLKSRTKIVFLVSVQLLSILYVVLVESRAGILCMGLLFVFLFAWLFFLKKKRMLTLCVGTMFSVVIVIFFLMFPSGLERIIDTKLVNENQIEDVRITHLKAGLSVIEENYLFGVGVGDRTDALNEYYVKNGSWCVGYNSHNQYVDTTVSIGILGLLALLGYFVVPIVLFYVNKDWDVVFMLFLFMIAFNAVFEAIFETQKGILFFNYIYCLLFYDRFVCRRALQDKRLETND